MNNTSLLVSVIVCTYNRAKLLHTCLQSLNNQTADKRLYEVIVVDNNSNDATQQETKSFIKNRHSFRLVSENKQGLSSARNRGWQEAKGKYVAYIDDDAFADRNWIAEIISFTKKFPAVGVFGGPYKRYFLTPSPHWFPDGYGTLDLGRKIKQIHPPKEWLTGTNMIFQKDMFNKYSGFDTRFGMRGKYTVYGEETDFMFRLHKLGEQIYYVPMIKVNHLVAEYKYNLQWLLKGDFFHSYSSSQFIRTKFNLMKGILFFLWSLLVFPFCLFNTKTKLLKTRAYYGLSRIFLALGQIIGSVHELLDKIRTALIIETFYPGVISLFFNPFYFARKGLIENIRPLSKNIKGIILDVGCGNKPYKQLFNKASKYIGMDIKQSGHDHTNEDIDIYFDGKKFPFKQNMFDSVVSFQVFEHVFNPDEFLEEISRVLKRQGYLLMTAPLIWDEHEQPNDFARYTSYGLKFLLQKHHFEIIKSQKSIDDIRAIFQVITCYIFKNLYKKRFYQNQSLRLLTNLMFISPFNIIGTIISWIPSKNNDLYLNNVILAKKS